MHARTHTTMSGTTRVGRYQKKHSPTHTHNDHPTYFTTSSTMIYSILLVQCMCLTVLFHNLSPGPLWSSSWFGALYFISHAFLTQSPSSFHNTCPYHCNRSAVVPMLCQLFLISLSAPYLEICLNATHPPDHSHLCSLKCQHVFFPYRPGLTSMQHAV